MLSDIGRYYQILLLLWLSGLGLGLARQPSLELRNARTILEILLLAVLFGHFCQVWVHLIETVAEDGAVKRGAVQCSIDAELVALDLRSPVSWAVVGLDF